MRQIPSSKTGRNRPDKLPRIRRFKSARTTDQIYTPPNPDPRQTLTGRANETIRKEGTGWLPPPPLRRGMAAAGADGVGNPSTEAAPGGGMDEQGANGSEW
jgi:hypothetical protein